MSEIQDGRVHSHERQAIFQARWRFEDHDDWYGDEFIGDNALLEATKYIEDTIRENDGLDVASGGHVKLICEINEYEFKRTVFEANK